jgi:uncharacterized protein with NRDE domain
MCLLIMAWQTDDRAPLVVGANRDERLDRPATAMTVLRSEHPRILGGRDEVAGGTWLAVNEYGVVAGLTNRPAREGRDLSKRSRGELPLALAQHLSASEAVEDFTKRFSPKDYNPAWLLVGDRDLLYSLDMTGPDDPVAQKLAPGVHILENQPLDAGSPKAAHVRALLGPVCKGGLQEEALLDRLSEVLSDHSLPDEVVSQVVENDSASSSADALSDVERRIETLAACVHSEDYGTRSSTIVRVPSELHGLVTVRVADGAPCKVPFYDMTRLWDGGVG